MINHEMLKIARAMVEIPSVNTTSGEKKIGEFIESYIREIPYFKQHPEQVVIRELKNDTLHRRNIFALLIGEASQSGKTLVFHGHTDTVGIEDYGSLKDVACKPLELEEKLKTMQLPLEVEIDLNSGDYMFGRGSCDMKSGDAVFLGMLLEMSEKVNELSGNILVSFNPVEENLHTGIIEGLEVLEELKGKYGLQYVLAINNDFICPLFEDDIKYSLYTGTVGKLLPCFYIQGKETHVGQCFEGFDASMIAAGLVEKINLNTDFCDEYMGEYSYPPSVLKMKDLKPWYNVQTASEALVYFNYFVHNASMQEITGKLKKAAEKVLEETMMKIHQMSEQFSVYSGQKYIESIYPIQVLTYQELLEKAKSQDSFSDDMLCEILKEEENMGTDKREIPVAMIRYLLRTIDLTTPCIVLYYAAPYCPHNTLQGEDEVIIDQIQKIAKTISEKNEIKYRFMKFFPSLSDSSYLKIDDNEESITQLVHNFAGFEQLYPIPLEQIQRLNIPSVNYGCYGKDAHKWTERVNIPYTFGILPELINETIQYYLYEKKED